MSRRMILKNICVVAAVVLAIGVIAVAALTSSPNSPNAQRSPWLLTADAIYDPAHQESVDALRAIGMTDDEIKRMLERNGRFLSADNVLRQRQSAYERMQTNLTYILGNPFQGRISPSTEGATQADLHTIERFVFTTGHAHGGSGLVIDILHGRVYFNPRAGSGGLSILRLDHSEHRYAEFKEYDLERLVRAIEESSLLDWQENIRGEVIENAVGGTTAWHVGIRFPDNIFLRRTGSGHSNFHPPAAQWKVLTDFINTLGEEIIERHAAETAARQVDESVAEFDRNWTIAVTQVRALAEHYGMDAHGLPMLPHYLGGIYTNEGGRLVMLIVDSAEARLELEMDTFLTDFVYANGIITRYVEFSEAYLRFVKDVIGEAAFNMCIYTQTATADVASNLAYSSIDIINNRVVVNLFHFDEEGVELFRTYVFDSPSLYFMQSNILLVNDD